MKIGLKYSIAIGFIILLFVTSTVITSINMMKLKDDYSVVISSETIASDMLQICLLLQGEYIDLQNYMFAPIPTHIDDYTLKMKQFDLISNRLIRLLKGKDLDYFSKVVTNHNAMVSFFQKDIVENIDVKNKDAVAEARNKFDKLKFETFVVLDDLRMKLNSETSKADSNAQEKLMNTITVLVITLVCSVISGVLFSMLISRGINKNLNKIVKVSKKLARGDLDIEKICFDSKDEIGDLAIVFNIMSQKIKGIMSKISSLSHNLHGKSINLSSFSNQVKTGSDMMTSSILEMDEGLSEITGNTTMIYDSVFAIDNEINLANQTVTELKKIFGIILNFSADGNQKMDNSIDTMKTIKQKVSDSVTEVNDLEQKYLEISNLASIVMEISEQSRLLALNASIEAAKSGSYGNEFRVIANEMCKLSDKGKNSVGVIKKIMQGLTVQSKKISVSLDAVNSEVSKGRDKILDTCESFKNIKSSVEKIVSQIEKTSSSLNIIVKSSSRLNDSVGQLHNSAKNAKMPKYFIDRPFKDI